MAEQFVSDFNGVDTYQNPFNVQDGNIIHCVNLQSDTNGSRIKRPGYSAYLGTPDTSEITSLFSWTREDGSTLFTYRASGSSLYYSTQGTGVWTKCGNGTIANGAHVTHGVLEDQMIIGDGVGTMKYTTNGTSFTDIPLAPVGGHHPVDYQGRMYVAGTNSFIFYSTVGTVSDWTTDSSSILIGGPGKVHHQFKASDRLVTQKDSGLLHRWDGESLVDMATQLGASSPWSPQQIEDFWFYINRKGIFTTNANKPQLISNPIQRQIFNTDDTGISDSVFDTAPAGIWDYDYMVSVGTVTDNLTQITIPNALIAYDYKHNEFINYQFAHKPTAFHSFKNASKANTFIFGDANGQVYQMANSSLSDAGQAIESQMVVVLHGNMPHVRKDFGYIEFWTSPGCPATIQFCVEDVVSSTSGQRMVTGPKVWKELGGLTKGYTLFRFPPETRGRILYLRLYEAGKSKPWSIYSLHYTYEPVML